MKVAMQAIDIKALTLLPLQLNKLGGIRLLELPTTDPIVPSGLQRNHAVLSWRWDVDQQDNSSRNIAAAILHAIDARVDCLFIDKLSIDQSLKGIALIESVVAFSQLFRTVPVLAAYDTPELTGDDRHFLRTMRRPWIATEVLEMRSNPHELSYVGHIPGQGAADSFGFRHMADRIWDTNFANSLLYVLMGFCDMHDHSELAQLMPENNFLVSAVSRTMTREDALLSAAILAQAQSSDGDERVNGDINLRQIGFKAFKFSPAESSLGYWSNWLIFLNGEVVATWSEKNFTRDGSPRRKLSPITSAAKIIGRFVGLRSVELEADSHRHSPSEVSNPHLPPIRSFDLSDRLRIYDALDLKLDVKR